jgi:HK97 family phage major capsid protein
LSDLLVKAIDELKASWESDFKPQVDAMNAEIKKHGDATGETKQVLSRVQDRLDDIEAKATKAALYANRGARGEMSDERKHFIEFSRTGEAPEGVKMMTASDESTGGVLAPSDFVAEVIKGIIEFSPVRGIARVRPTSARSSKFPKRTGRAAATWTGEKGTRSNTQTPTFGLEEVPNHELYARVEISSQDLEDSVVDLEADIIEQMAEQFGVSEGTGFISGDANGKPEGIISNADVIAAAVMNGGASFTNGDGLIKLRFELKEAYWAKARMLLNRLTLRDIRLLKDGNDNYLWTPGIGQGAGLAQGVPATIVDTPYTLATDMPVAASNAFTVACGDFSKAYMISDRIQLSWLRDPYTAAGDGAVVFHARKRVGGQVVLPEAVKLLKMAA